MFYVTQDLKYALEFSRNNPRDKWGYLYQCHIIDNLDIFNAKDSMDRVKLKRWLVSMEWGTQCDIRMSMMHIPTIKCMSWVIPR